MLPWRLWGSCVACLGCASWMARWATSWKMATCLDSRWPSRAFLLFHRCLPLQGPFLATLVFFALYLACQSCSSCQLQACTLSQLMLSSYVAHTSAALPPLNPDPLAPYSCKLSPSHDLSDVPLLYSFHSHTASFGCKVSLLPLSRLMPSLFKLHISQLTASLSLYARLVHLVHPAHLVHVIPGKSIDQVV